MQNLKILALNNNKIEDFPRVILELNKLTSLRLSKNKLKAIPEDLIDHLPAICELNLLNNEITSLPLCLLNRSNLKLKYDRDKVKERPEVMQN